MKTIIILAHPNIEQSSVNKRWKEAIENYNPEVKIHDIYKTYPDWKIDVEAEQKLLSGYDRIIFQYPIYWFGMPPLLKKWFDDVLTYGWAYGTSYAFENKEFGVAVSTGGSKEAYTQGGPNSSSIETYLSPIEGGAKYLRAKYLSHHVFYGALHTGSAERLEENAKEFVKYVTA